MRNDKKMNKDNIEIARSYSRTIQLELFTSTSVFMSAKVEISDDTTKKIRRHSDALYDLCKKTVDSDIEKLKSEKEKTKKIVRELS